jgi:hypothetical protein
VENLLFIGLIVFAVWYFYKKLKYKNVDFTINLNIDSEDDYIEAQKKLKELSAHIRAVDAKSNSILSDAIKQLQSAINNYENNRARITVEYSSSSSYDDNDSWEGTVYESDESFGISANFKIKYTDSKGSFSEREVTVRNAGTINGKKAIFGYCKLRNQSRTFIINQISECIDLDTGEFIKDIYTYLENKYENSPEKIMCDVEINEKDILNILTYVGRADTRYQKEEKLIVCDTVRKLSVDNHITDEVINRALDSFGLISLQSFKLAVGRVSSRPDEVKQLVLDATKQIIGTQKTVHPMEQVALDYIQKKFNM